MFHHKEWHQLPEEAIRSTFGANPDEPFIATVKFPDSEPILVSGVLKVQDSLSFAHLIDHRRTDQWVSPFTIHSQTFNPIGKLIFSDEELQAEVQFKPYQVPTLGIDISPPWTIPRAATVILETSTWPGYGKEDGQPFDTASVRIGGLPRLMKDLWTQTTSRSYQEPIAQHYAYAGLTLEANGWNLSLKESPGTNEGNTYFYVGTIQRQNQTFSTQELEEFLTIVELFLSVITSQRKRFDCAVAFQTQLNPTDQRLRLIGAENTYSPVSEIDPNISQLDPWLELFGKFHSAYQDQDSGPMFQEAVKRYISAATIARYSPYPITQTWAALESVAKVSSGKLRGNIKPKEVKHLINQKAEQLASLPEPYAWKDQNGHWETQAEKVRHNISHGNIIDHHEPEMWFITQRLVRALIMTYLRSNP